MNGLTPPVSHPPPTTPSAQEDAGQSGKSNSESRPLITESDIAEVVGRISQVLPAGNVPEMVRSGLERLKGRRLPQEEVKHGLSLWMQGLGNKLEEASYLGFFGGPAAAIWAYQKLLSVAGVDMQTAFPEGVWQFYVGYGLREDTARHTNETYGFDATLSQQDIHLDLLERMTAWIMAAISCLHQYDEILANEWRERVYLCELREMTRTLPESDYYAGLYHQWRENKPYGRASDAKDDENYPLYRLNKFKRFINDSVRTLPRALSEQWKQRIYQLEKQMLPAYQQQMSILTSLLPTKFEEIRQPVLLERANVGVIFRGHYYLIPICEPGTMMGAHIESVSNRVAAILGGKLDIPGVSLIPLARTKRSAIAGLREKLSPEFLDSIKPLAMTPILLNFDAQSCELPLAEIRQSERGLGDHPLTIFDTGRSFVFDQSHIFFDGAWGAALSEIMTNEAISWALYLDQFPMTRFSPFPPRRLEFIPTSADQTKIASAPKTTLEASAETDRVNIRAIILLRRLFKRRSDLLQLTVNDILVLFRAIHAFQYRPSESLLQKLRVLMADTHTRRIAEAILQVLHQQTQTNPSILIPVDASFCSPRERVHPLSFEVPLNDLNLLQLHKHTIKALDIFDQGGVNRQSAYQYFDKFQREYLTTLAGFGRVLDHTKQVAVGGQTASVGTLKMLAHMPAPVQKMMDNYSHQFDWMNDLIKGREVFSNIGRVIYTSTLSRFMTAKDDNDQKDLAWGIITDKDDILRITLRDFRPHVAALAELGLKLLADEIVQDYLDAYAEGLNQYIKDLHRITVASRETKMASKSRSMLHLTRKSE